MRAKGIGMQGEEERKRRIWERKERKKRWIEGREWGM